MITIYDCHENPIFKSDNFEDAALFYITHWTAFSYDANSDTEDNDFSLYLETIGDKRGQHKTGRLYWYMNDERITIASNKDVEERFFPYSKLKKLVSPDNIEDYKVSSFEYGFKEGTLICEKVCRTILDIIKQERKDYNI